MLRILSSVLSFSVLLLIFACPSPKRGSNARGSISDLSEDSGLKTELVGDSGEKMSASGSSGSPAVRDAKQKVLDFPSNMKNLVGKDGKFAPDDAVFEYIQSKLGTSLSKIKISFADRPKIYNFVPVDGIPGSSASYSVEEGSEIAHPAPYSPEDYFVHKYTYIGKDGEESVNISMCSYQVTDARVKLYGTMEIIKGTENLSVVFGSNSDNKGEHCGVVGPDGKCYGLDGLHLDTNDRAVGGRFSLTYDPGNGERITTETYTDLDTEEEREIFNKLGLFETN